MERESRQTILFVDDEETILDIAREYFQNLGYNVLTARNGREAVDIINDKSKTIDCCFTDINMPEMDGLELAEYLRKTDNTIPVVIMTGYPSLDNTIQTMKNGVVDFLIKPVDLNQMAICLHRTLRERELFINNILLHKEVESKRRLERLNRELVFKVDELRILNKIMSELMLLRTGAEVFDHMVNMATTITNAKQAIFFIVSESMKEPFELTVSISEEPDEQLISDDNAKFESENKEKDIIKIVSPLFNNLIKEISSDKIPLLISGHNTINYNLPMGIGSFMGIPLKIRDKVFGVLAVFTEAGSSYLNEKDLYYLNFMIQQASYMVENIALHENIYENLLSTLSAFVKTVEARDEKTKEHSNRVTDTAIIIANAMQCTKEDIDVLNFAGRLHDIGKIGIRDDILLKPGILTQDEYEKIKEHPLIGESIIGLLGMWDREKKIVRCHHERFDGSGYPDGLKGDAIPALARVLSVADVFDAMVSERSYRKEMPIDKVLTYMYDQKQKQFDPNVVELFFKLYREGSFKKVYWEII